MPKPVRMAEKTVVPKNKSLRTIGMLRYRSIFFVLYFISDNFIRNKILYYLCSNVKSKNRYIIT